VHTLPPRKSAGPAPSTAETSGIAPSVGMRTDVAVLTPAQAIDAIRNALPDIGFEKIALTKAVGRILRQTVTAERDQPPFDRVTMDGIALQFDAIRGGARRFRIQATQHAGDPVATLTDHQACIEVMTGAVMPRRADCVIPVERISVENGYAGIEPGYSPARVQFVHPQGSDHRKGQVLLRPGMPVSPLEVAIIASCGLQQVSVSCRPPVRIISTGSELVPAGSDIEAHQVRMSNGPALVAMLSRHGFSDCEHQHVVDQPALLRNRLAQHLEAAPVLILSGGVSMGKADFVPAVLAELGVRQVFHKVSQRPGKPLWFGIGPRDQAVFALPGNPVSTLVCCRHYVLPALYAASGRNAPKPWHAVLGAEVEFEANLTCFLPVTTASRDDGLVVATPVPTNTSGDFTALGGTDGYVELRPDSSRFPAGTCVPLHLWDRP
jgi:molybdopterin molybdotransferase